MTAQTTPSYSNVKLTKLPVGNLHDSVVLTNGSTKLLKFLPVSQIKGTTNLDYTASPTGGTVFSSTGNDAVLPLATTTNAGLLSPTDKGQINEIDAIKSQINPNTYVVTDAGSSLVINDFTLNAGWSWKINNVTNTNASPVVITIPLANSGYQRIDLIVLNASNTAVRVVGTESAGTAASPTIPVNTIAIASIFSDSTVHTPVIPKPRYPVTQFLRNGVTDYSPSEDVVYDALALKKNISTGNNYKWETTNATGNLQETTVTPSRAVATDANGLPTASSTTATELGYVNGVTSAIQTQLNTKLSSFGSVTTNYLPKVTGTNVFGNSRIFDTGTFLGIGTVNAPTKDLTLGNQSNKEIGVERSESTINGRDLILSSGTTVNYALSTDYVNTSPDAFWHKSLSFNVNGNLYSTVANGGNGGVYVQTGATGTSSRIYGGIAQVGTIASSSVSGDIYISGLSVPDIYISTNGGTAFNSLNTGMVMSYLYADFNNNIYGTRGNSLIYKRTNNSGSFNSLSGITARNYEIVLVHPNGNIYSTVSGIGDVYMQTNGAGDFNPLGLPSRAYTSGTITPNGNVYLVSSGVTYLQTDGTGAFIAQGSLSNHPFTSLVTDTVGNIYGTDGANCQCGGLWKLNLFASGTANLNGGTLTLKAGTGKGTGSSKIQFITGQKTTSGTNMQIETVRGSFNEKGNFNITTCPVYSDNTDAISNGLIVGDFYRTSTGVLMIVY